MSDKKQREHQAKQQLNLTDEQFKMYQNIDYTNSVWDEIINDYSLPFNYADLAAHFKKAHVDLTNPDYVSLLKIYNEKTESLEPLKLSFTDSETGELKAFPAEGKKMNKDLALQFLKNLDEKLKKGDRFLDLNTYFATENRVYFVTKKERNYDFASHNPDGDYNTDKPSSVQKPSTYQSITNSLFGWYKTQVDEYKEYSKKLADNKKLKKETNHLYDLIRNIFGTDDKDLKQRFDQEKEEFKLYSDVTKKVKGNRTVEDRQSEYVTTERGKSDCIELVAGRSTKLLGRHENYKKLTEIPLVQSDTLPMSGLALLVSNSLDINRSIVDASTQQAQKFVPKPGVVLTADEQQFIKEMEISSEINNVGAKIMESFYGGSDILRMGNRGTAAVEGRIKLNEAAAEYQKGNKEPLIKLIKDSIPAVIDYAKDVKENITTSSGQALSEISDSLKKLFKDDPELKTAVGCPDEDLNMLYAASAFAKKVVNPAARRDECFKKHMVQGSENKADFIREMLYTGFLVKKFAVQVSKTYDDAENAVKDIVAADVEDLFLKLDVPGEVPYKVKTSIKNGVSGKYTSDIRKWPDIYSFFENEPADESSLIAEFDELYANTPEYKALLEKTPDELMTMNFDSAFNQIYKAHISEAENKEAEKEHALKESVYQKHVETDKVWDELISEHSLSPALGALARRFQTNSIDVSDPDEIGLLAVYNKEKGVVEPVSLAGHKGEPGYPSATGFTHDKAGITEFLKALDASLKNGDQLLIYNQLVTGNTIDSYVKGEQGYDYQLVNPKDLDIGKLPPAVEEPGGFKKLMHSVFGGYKKDFEKYNNYITEKANYDRRLSERKAYNESINSFSRKNWIKLNELKKKQAAYNDINVEVQKKERMTKEAAEIIEKQKESIREKQLKDTHVKSFEPNQDYRKPELETIEELEEPEDEPEIKPQKKAPVKKAPKLTLDDKIRISRNITERDSFVFYDGNRADRVKDTRKALYQAFFRKDRDNIKSNIAKLFYISSVEQKLSNAIKEKKFDEVYAKLENSFEPEEMQRGINDLLGSKEFNAYVQQMKPQEIKDIAYSKTEPAALNQIDKADIYGENRQDSLAPAKLSMKKFMGFTKELKANAEKEAQKNASKTEVKEEKSLGNILSGN